MQYRDETETPDKLGAIVYAAMFTVYIGAIVLLAIIGVPYVYFFAVIVAGLPVSGVTLSLLQGSNWLKQQTKKEYDAATVLERVDPSEFRNNDGQPVIRL